MFEDYLEDAYFFASLALATEEEREAKRYFRASIFYAMSAIEAFINYIGNIFEQGDIFHPHEIGFLTDRKYSLHQGRFQIIDQMEYHRLEEKLRFLIVKFINGFDFEQNPSWSQLIDFKRLRDIITHPRKEEDEISLIEYKTKIQKGIGSILNIMNYLCNGIFGRPLRKKLIDLIP
jgi:hypothetical protein